MIIKDEMRKYWQMGKWQKEVGVGSRESGVDSRESIVGRQQPNYNEYKNSLIHSLSEKGYK